MAMRPYKLAPLPHAPGRVEPCALSFAATGKGGLVNRPKCWRRQILLEKFSKT